MAVIKGGKTSKTSKTTKRRRPLTRKLIASMSDREYAERHAEITAWVRGGGGLNRDRPSGEA